MNAILRPTITTVCMGRASPVRTSTTLTLSMMVKDEFDGLSCVLCPTSPETSKLFKLVNVIVYI